MKPFLLQINKPVRGPPGAVLSFKGWTGVYLERECTSVVWLRRPDLGESSSYECHERINAAPMSCPNTPFRLKMSLMRGVFLDANEINLLFNDISPQEPPL